jgi:hypothetical protein
MELMRRKRVDSASYPNMMKAAEKAQFTVPFADDAQVNSVLSLKTLIFTSCFFFLRRQWRVKLRIFGDSAKLSCAGLGGAE